MIETTDIRLVVDNTRRGGAMSVRDVAVRWDCSDRRVRGLISEGRLQFFRLGSKLICVPISAVVEFEQCQPPTCKSSPTAASTPPSSPKTESVVVAPLGLTIRAKWSPSSLTLARKLRPEAALRS